jgi:two-component system chemotaxis response regulator CheB
MIAAQGESVERALWAALRALEERTALLDKLARIARDRGHHHVAELFDERIRVVADDVKSLHNLIMNGGTLERVGQEGV